MQEAETTLRGQRDGAKAPEGAHRRTRPRDEAPIDDQQKNGWQQRLCPTTYDINRSVADLTIGHVCESHSLEAVDSLANAEVEGVLKIKQKKDWCSSRRKALTNVSAS